MATSREDRKPSSEEIETIVLHHILVLVIGAGIGVYLPVLWDKPVTADSLATFTIAALAPLVTDVLVQEPYWVDLRKRGRMRLGVLAGFSVLASFAALIRYEKPYDLTSAMIGAAFALWLLYRVAVLSGRFVPETLPKTEDGGAEVQRSKLSGGGLQ